MKRIEVKELGSKGGQEGLKQDAQMERLNVEITLRDQQIANLELKITQLK
jgi:hypothetical protein